MVIRVEEPATCQYIITIHSKSLCNHPAFKVEEKIKKVSLVCAPILSAKAYKKFQEEQILQKEEEGRQRKLKEEEQLKLEEQFRLEKIKFEKGNRTIPLRS